MRVVDSACVADDFSALNVSFRRRCIGYQITFYACFIFLNFAYNINWMFSKHTRRKNYRQRKMNAFIAVVSWFSDFIVSEKSSLSQSL